MGDDQIDYEEDEYGGAQKMQYQGGGAIPALAEEEIGEDDEYDDLYNDVNVGENFLQMHRPEMPAPPASIGNGGLQARTTHESRVDTGAPQGHNIPVDAVAGKYANSGAHFPQHNVGAKGLETVGYSDESSVPQKGRVIEMNHDAQTQDIGFQGQASAPPNIGVDPTDMSRKFSNESAAMLNTVPPGHRSLLQVPANQMSMGVDANRPLMNENQTRPAVENGTAMLFYVYGTAIDIKMNPKGSEELKDKSPFIVEISAQQAAQPMHNHRIFISFDQFTAKIIPPSADLRIMPTTV